MCFCFCKNLSATALRRIPAEERSFGTVSKAFTIKTCIEGDTANGAPAEPRFRRNSTPRKLRKQALTLATPKTAPFDKSAARAWRDNHLCQCKHAPEASVQCAISAQVDTSATFSWTAAIVQGRTFDITKLVSATPQRETVCSVTTDQP